MTNFGNAGGGGGPPFGDPRPPPELRFAEPPVTPVRIPRSAPWEVPPPGAITFFGQARTSVTGVVGGDVTAVLAPQNTPSHFVGVIRELTFQINDVVSTTDVNFTLRFNQGPVQGYSLDVFPKSASHDLIEYDPNVTMIRIPLEALIDIIIRVRDGDVGTYVVGASFKGWWYAENLDALWEKYGGGA